MLGKRKSMCLYVCVNWKCAQVKGKFVSDMKWNCVCIKVKMCLCLIKGFFAFKWIYTCVEVRVCLCWSESLYVKVSV